jgi:hypothetical protein
VHPEPTSDATPRNTATPTSDTPGSRRSFEGSCAARRETRPSHLRIGRSTWINGAKSRSTGCTPSSRLGRRSSPWRGKPCNRKSHNVPHAFCGESARQAKTRPRPSMSIDF